MELIVAGLGRTGTMSLSQALQMLDLRVVAQEQLIRAPERLEAVVGMVRGEQPFDAAVFGDAQASIGWPLCWTWQAQLAHWPEAKCLLNVRDADAWFDSVERAWPVLATLRRLPYPPKARLVDLMLSVLEDKMGGPIGRELWKAGYERHIEEVVAGVPPERLLVWEVGAGWEPICAFIDRPVPSAPFPRGNSSKGDAFAKRVKEMLWR